MQSFCFIILHIPGRVNRVADFLSRSGAQLAFLNIFFALSGMADLSEDFWHSTGSAAELKVVPTSSMCALPAPESFLSEVFSEKSSGLAKSEIMTIFGQSSDENKATGRASQQNGPQQLFPSSPTCMLSISEVNLVRLVEEKVSDLAQNRLSSISDQKMKPSKKISKLAKVIKYRLPSLVEV